MRWLVVVAMFVEPATSSCISCPSSCVDVIAVELVIDPAAIAGDVLTACKNDACATGAVPATDSSSSLLGGVMAEAIVDEHGLRLDFDHDGPYDDGDVYSIELTTPSGAEAIARSAVATYQRVDVCGMQCTQFGGEL
jgi:hypothetical protein